ncbi:hypothetical protein VTL71DRAFT_15456 [Oculimacula yallundae]|uniref:Uncharacterized protein n=1 Tax=Oculimacula yallundae TaxID=86028 RepID=A0ABR4CGS8_9HELO
MNIPRSDGLDNISPKQLPRRLTTNPDPFCNERLSDFQLQFPIATSLQLLRPASCLCQYGINLGLRHLPSKTTLKKLKYQLHDTTYTTVKLSSNNHNKRSFLIGQITKTPPGTDHIASLRTSPNYH